jgi:glutamine synthetase
MKGSSSGASKKAKAHVRRPKFLGIESETRAREASDVVARLRSEGISRAKIGGFDIDGVLRGKYVSLDKLESALAKGFGFCDVIFGWDVADALYEQSRVTGWHTGYPDTHGFLDPTTERRIPWEPGVAAFLADFRDDKGRPHPACPRSLLKRVVSRAEGLGFSPKLSAEFEFFFFRETRETLAQKHFRDLTPLDPGMFGYSWLRSGQDAELMRDLHESLSASDIPVEGLHTETGPGVYEAALAVDCAIRAADNAALFKTIVKQVAHRHGLVVTFMAKWNAGLPGSSGHLHQSLWREGKNAFHEPKSGGMSSVMRHYIGGQMALMRELTALMSPTINSYKRYVPGVWAPLTPSWGFENRTCALRIIGLGHEKACHVEHRQGAADINPYVAMAASLGAGLWGVEKRLDPGSPTQGDAGDGGDEGLPRTLSEAADLLSESKAARALFGSEFIDHYVMTRRWEVEVYRRAVTDWELQRYFEII